MSNISNKSTWRRFREFEFSSFYQYSPFFPGLPLIYTPFALIFLISPTAARVNLLPDENQDKHIRQPETGLERFFENICKFRAAAAITVWTEDKRQSLWAKFFAYLIAGRDKSFDEFFSEDIKYNYLLLSCTGSTRTES